VLGCLTWPFRMLGCLTLVALLALGWLYRDRIVPELRRLLGEPPVIALTLGRPDAAALRTAERKVASMRREGADSVTLSADEMASLMADGLDPAVRRQLDSLAVRLEADAVTVRARLYTARLPKELVGPLAVALRDWEPVEAGGPVTVVAPGRAEWEVRRFRLRDFPLPTDLVPRMMARALGDSARRALPVRLPRGVRDLRVTPDGVTLYGASRP
jgi:hypothetical protein